MTNEIKKRVNKASQVKFIACDSIETIANALIELQQTEAPVYPCTADLIIQDENGEQSINDKYVGSEYQLVIIPNYSADNPDKLAYSSYAIIPSFEAVINDEAGKRYLADAFNSKAVKRIRDNLRIALAEDGKYCIPASVADFITVNRASGSGFSDEFKKAVTALCQGLIAKLSTKIPNAKALLTQKAMLTGLSSESTAKMLFPFLIGNDGNTILGKWLEKQAINPNFAKICESLLASRNDEQTEDVDINTDDLLDL